MMRLRLRVMTAAFNAAVAQYALARLELTASHPRIVAPPVIDRLGARDLHGDGAKQWKAALRQVHDADAYVKTGASAVARRDKVWAQLTAAFIQLKVAAAGIEVLRVSGTGVRKRRS
jgi:hypothetical protein